MKGLGFHKLKYFYERVGKSVILLVKRPKRTNNPLYGCEKVQETFWFCDLFL